MRYFFVKGDFMTAVLPLLLTFAALYLAVHPDRTDRVKECAPFPWGQLLLALSGTLGVGNITGVAAAILLGGKGSVFWMCLSALVALVLKNAEGRVCRRSGHEIGMVGALRPLPLGRYLAPLWAGVALLLAFVMGAALQANAIAATARAMGLIKPLWITLFLTVGIGALLGRRVEAILGRLSILLPLATILYVGLCLFVILCHRAQILPLLAAVFRDAFTIRSTAGGLFGFALSEGMRRGFGVGLLSNEAGAGTSTLAQTASTPLVHAGRIGMLEVVFDTLVLCPLSALTLLLAGDATLARPSDFLQSAFLDTYGAACTLPLFVSISLFAISTILCWYLYAARLLSYFHGMKKGSGSLRLPYLFCIFVGTLLPELLLVCAADTLLFFLSCMTVYALVLHARTGR